MRRVCPHDPLGASLLPCDLCSPGAGSDEAEPSRIDRLDHEPDGVVRKPQDDTDAGARIAHRHFDERRLRFDLNRIQDAQVLEACAHWVKVRLEDGSEFVCPIRVEHDGKDLSFVHGFPFVENVLVELHILYALGKPPINPQ